MFYLGVFVPGVCFPVLFCRRCAFLASEVLPPQPRPTGAEHLPGNQAGRADRPGPPLGYYFQRKPKGNTQSPGK